MCVSMYYHTNNRTYLHLGLFLRDTDRPLLLLLQQGGAEGLAVRHPVQEESGLFTYAYIRVCQRWREVRGEEKP